MKRRHDEVNNEDGPDKKHKGPSWWSASVLLEAKHAFLHAATWQMPLSIHGKYTKSEDARLYYPQFDKGHVLVPIAQDHTVQWLKDGQLAWRLSTQVRQWTIDPASGDLLVVPEPYPPRDLPHGYDDLPLLAMDGNGKTRTVTDVPYGIRSLHCRGGRVFYVAEYNAPPSMLIAVNIQTGAKETLIHDTFNRGIVHDGEVRFQDGRLDEHAKFQPRWLDVAWRDDRRMVTLEQIHPDPNYFRKTRVVLRKIDLEARTVCTWLDFESPGGSMVAPPVVDASGNVLLLGPWAFEEGIVYLQRIDAETGQRIVLPLLTKVRACAYRLVIRFAVTKIHNEAFRYSLCLDQVGQRLFVIQHGDGPGLSMHQVHGHLFTSHAQMMQVAQAWAQLCGDFVYLAPSLWQLVASYACP